jgi:hypothetical protein
VSVTTQQNHISPYWNRPPATNTDSSRIPARTVPLDHSISLPPERGISAVDSRHNWYRITMRPGRLPRGVSPDMRGSGGSVVVRSSCRSTVMLEAAVVNRRRPLQLLVVCRPIVAVGVGPQVTSSQSQLPARSNLRRITSVARLRPGTAPCRRCWSRRLDRDGWDRVGRWLRPRWSEGQCQTTLSQLQSSVELFRQNRSRGVWQRSGLGGWLLGAGR